LPKRVALGAENLRRVTAGRAHTPEPVLSAAGTCNAAFHHGITGQAVTLGLVPGRPKTRATVSPAVPTGLPMSTTNAPGSPELASTSVGARSRGARGRIDQCRTRSSIARANAGN
jgi:hypothetical protein